LDKLVPVFAEYPDTDITILDIQISLVLQITTETFWRAASVRNYLSE
jgi:hypothetical protein